MSGRSFPNAAPRDSGTLSVRLLMPHGAKDFSRFVAWHPHLPSQQQHWLVLGQPSRGSRCGQVGIALGTLVLKPSGGAVVVLVFPSGQLDSFPPDALAPWTPVEP